MPGLILVLHFMVCAFPSLSLDLYWGLVLCSAQVRSLLLVDFVLDLVDRLAWRSILAFCVCLDPAASQILSTCSCLFWLRFSREVDVFLASTLPLTR
jgi:hypothetical protein